MDLSKNGTILSILLGGGTLEVYTNNKLQVTMLSTHLKDPLEQWISGESDSV